MATPALRKAPRSPGVQALLQTAPLLMLVAAGPAFAQTVRDDFYMTNGTVNAVATAGDTLYVGGSFTAVGLATGAGVPLDAVSGVAVPGFPRVAGQVHAVVPDGNGGWYIGGAFTSVAGLPRANLAHVLVSALTTYPPVFLRTYPPCLPGDVTGGTSLKPPAVVQGEVGVSGGAGTTRRR
jgi:hypothetical protein